MLTDMERLKAKYETLYIHEYDKATHRLQLLSRAMNALEGWRILLDMPITDIMKDIEKELGDD